MPDAPGEVSGNELYNEYLRLKGEIERVTKASQETDPTTGKPTLPALQANQRLDKLNDDFRQLLIAMKPAASTVNPDVREVDGRIIQTTPGGVSSQVWPLNGAAPAPKPTTPSQMGQVVGGTLYVPDPNDPTKWSAVTPQSPDDQKKIADIQQRQYNQALTGRYMTDQESIEYQQKVNQLGYDKAAQDRLKAETESKLRQAEQDFMQKAALFPGALQKQGADIEATRTSTAATQAGIGKTQQDIEQSAQRFPGELRQQGLTAQGTELSNQRTQQQIIQGNAPTVQTPPTGMYQWSRDPNTGALIQGALNPEWQAKTMPEVQARIGQIQSAMQAKGAEVQAKVDAKTITAEQGLQEYKTWYAQQVQPQLSALDEAQKAAQFKQAQDIAAMRTSAQTAATAAGTMGVNAFNAMREAHPVGPDFAAQMNKIASRSPYMKDVDFGSTVWQGPSPVDLAQQQSQKALQYIDSTAAQANGLPAPNLSSVDIYGQLGAQKYAPGGGAPVAAAANPAPSTGPTFDQWLADLQGRQAADVQQQRLAQTIPGSGFMPGAEPMPYKPGWPGSDPRLSGILDPTLYAPGQYVPGS